MVRKITRMLAAITVIIFTVCAPVDANAQEKKCDIYISGGAKIVSSYLWRGLREAGVSFQPSMALHIENFMLEAWGSVDFAAASYKELDIKLAYQAGPVLISVNDVYAVYPKAQPGLNGGYNYFSYKKGAPHRVEGGIQWQITKSVPVTISWYTTLVGGSDYNEEGKRIFSSYLELSYPFMVKSVSMNAGIGMVPWNAVQVYGIDRDFYVQDIFVSAERTWEIKSMPGLRFGISTLLSWNPALADANVMCGFSIKM